MKRTTAICIRSRIIKHLTKIGFSELPNPVPGVFRGSLLRRDLDYAEICCASHLGTIKVSLIGGYIDPFVTELILEAKSSFNFPYIDWEPSIGSYLGENVDFKVGTGFGLSKSGELHYEGALDVCPAEHSTIGGIALPKNSDTALVKIDIALHMFSNIFTQLLPRLDGDLPFKEVPHYLFNHTGLPTLIACFARAVELGCGKEQFQYTAEKLIEADGFHFPGCKAIIPVLKKYV